MGTLALKHLLPCGFDAESIVGPLNADSARWLVSTVVRKLVANDVDRQGHAILSSAILQRVMGHGYARIVRTLIEAGVLERSNYRVGESSYGYRLTADYLAQRPRRVLVINPVLLDRMRKEYQRTDAKQSERRLPIHEALNEAQHGLAVLPAARVEVELLPRESRLCQFVHVDRIERRELPLTISTTGRVFNGLSGVKRELRRFVLLHGEAIGCIDVRNSQPALLGNLLLTGVPHQRGKRCSSIRHNAHARSPFRRLPLSLPFSSSSCFGSFVELASVGLLYDEIASLCSRDRDFVKKRFLVDVLAKKGDYPSEVERVFRERFPAVWQAIHEINRDSHCNLIRLLQRVEAWLVIEKVSPALVRRLPIVTLHDAIFSRQGDLELVEETFAEVLEEIGWRLSLKRETPS